MRYSFAILSILSLTSALVSAQDSKPQCSATTPCANGQCCSTAGYCGWGPEYCDKSKGCQNSCDSKSDCDPGWGTDWSKQSKCDLNVCCSKFGTCGTDADHCDGAVSGSSPSGGGNSTGSSTGPSYGGGSGGSCDPNERTSEKRTIAYYEGWAATRKCDKFMPEDLELDAYTHVNFAFVSIDPTSYCMVPASTGDEDLYKRIVALKEKKASLQTWISIGGWSFTDPGSKTLKTFSTIAADATAQQAFFKSLIQFMKTWGFDGVDIDWEYPAADDRGGSPEDKKNLVSLMKNMRKAFDTAGCSNFGITITLPASYWYLQGFELSSLAPFVNWFNMMTYDFHGTWEKPAIINHHTNLTDVGTALNLMWQAGIKPAQVVVGLAFYGRTYTLADPTCDKPGCLFSGQGPAGECSGEKGSLSYAEICRMLAKGGNKPVLDAAAGVKMLTYGDGNANWVGYDDAETFKIKTDFANKQCLGGRMIWAASQDDKENSAAKSLISGGGYSGGGPSYGGSSSPSYGGSEAPAAPSYPATGPGGSSNYPAPTSTAYASKPTQTSTYPSGGGQGSGESESAGGSEYYNLNPPPNPAARHKHKRNSHSRFHKHRRNSQ